VRVNPGELAPKDRLPHRIRHRASSIRLLYPSRGLRPACQLGLTRFHRKVRRTTVAQQPPTNNPLSGQPRNDLLGQLVPIVVALVVAIIGATPPLFHRGSIVEALGLLGFAAVVLVAVVILATSTGRWKKIWDRVKKIKTVLVMLLAAAVGFVVGVWVSRPTPGNPYIGHIVEWVNGSGQPNTSWLVGSNGKRYWIPDPSIFYCLVKERHTDLGPQTSTVLDDLPDSGQRAACS
jgi:hypothetical protein